MNIIEKISLYNKFGSKLDLSRMERLLALLGNPQEKMKIIHVAGTNGKGSVCRYVYEALRENGYTVGLYTSPFLERFTERIEANGKEISDEDLDLCGETVLQMAEKMVSQGFDSPTEFEIVTAIGLEYFKKTCIEFVLLEVGLGGRGDATNIVKEPLVTAITSIDFDHTAYLGDTLAKIATEKAGIVKPGVPMLSMASDESAKDAIRKKCKEKGSEFIDLTKIRPANIKKNIDLYEFDLPNIKNIKISMIGEHQIANATVALSILEILKNQHNIFIDMNRALFALKKAKQNGRFEVLEKDPYIIIDGAHNEAGILALKNIMNEHFADKKILTVMGILEEKITQKIFGDLADFTTDFIVTEPDNPRKLPGEILKKYIEKTNKNVELIKDPKEALDVANSKKEKYDVILFCGSLYLIGPIRKEVVHRHHL